MAQANQQQQAPNNQQQQQAPRQQSWFDRFSKMGKPQRTDNIQHDQNPNSAQQQQNNTGSQSQQQQQKQESPFDVYEGIFDNTPDEVDKRPAFALDGKLIDDAASRLDFTKDLPPELVERVKGMGEQGEVIMQLAAHMARGAYKTSVDHNARLTDTYIDKHYQPYAEKGLQKTVQEQYALTGIRSHEAFQHPVVGPLLQPIAKGLYKKYPDAPPEWIQEQTLKLFKEANSVLNPDNTKQQQEQQRAAPGGDKFNWDAYINGDDGKQDTGTPFMQQQNQQAQNFG